MSKGGDRMTETVQSKPCIADGDQCSACGAHQMPRWNPRGHEDARCCQSCGVVEEREVATTK